MRDLAADGQNFSTTYMTPPQPSYGGGFRTSQSTRKTLQTARSPKEKFFIVASNCQTKDDALRLMKNKFDNID